MQYCLSIIWIKIISLGEAKVFKISLKKMQYCLSIIWIKIISLGEAKDMPRTFITWKSNSNKISRIMLTSI